VAKSNSADLVEVVGKPLQVKPLYIGFTKKNIESEKYKADFDKAFLSLKADGTYNKIRAQYKIHIPPKN
jgi:ABC-type amino acid transport substrate-binding protein